MGGKPPVRLDWPGRQEEEPAPANLKLQTRVLAQESAGETNKAGGRLILGENLSVMTALAEELEGQIDLIYADPPFLSGKAYAARVGRGEDSRDPEKWKTVRGYQDTWTDASAYLAMLFPRLLLMHRLLAPTGTLYLHLDWHASAYARVLLDEVFGADRLLNEIIWIYHGPSPIRTAFKRKHDTILVYTKSKDYTFNADAVRVAYDPSTVKTFAASSKAGFGRVPDLERGKVPEDWWYFPVVARLHSERTGYPTQKPEAMLERIILASSCPGGTVADFFVGSGTTAVVASHLGRRWIACDVTPLAVSTTYRRLLLQDEIPEVALWQDEFLRHEAPANPIVSVEVAGKHVRLSLTGLEGSSPTPGPFPDNLVVWEVDWRYGTQVFHSRSRVVRPWQGKSIPLQMEHHYHESGEHVIAVRTIDASGHVGLTTLPINIAR